MKIRIKTAKQLLRDVRDRVIDADTFEKHPGWDDDMDQYLGRVLEATLQADGCYKSEEDWYWAPFAIEEVLPCKDIPPAGYRLLKESERGTKQGEYKYFHDGKWNKGTTPTRFNKVDTYAVPEDWCAELTVEQIQEKLGCKVKVIEG